MPPAEGPTALDRPRRGPKPIERFVPPTQQTPKHKARTGHLDEAQRKRQRQTDQPTVEEAVIDPEVAANAFEGWAIDTWWARNPPQTAPDKK